MREVCNLSNEYLVMREECNHKNVKYIKCFYTNPTSLNKDKISTLITLSEMRNLDIILIAETWFREDSCPNIDGYRLFRKDRKNRIGGGVCIYIKSSINAYMFQEFNSVNISNNEDDEVESVWCMIEVEKEKIMLGCVYRPKDSSAVVNERINEHIRNVKEMKCRNKISGFLIVGDFNYGEIRWPDAIGLDSGSAKTFKDGLDNNFIKQFVEFSLKKENCPIF